MGLFQQEKVAEKEGKKRRRNAKTPAQSHGQAEQETDDEVEREQRLRQRMHPLETVVAEGVARKIIQVPVVINAVAEDVSATEQAHGDPQPDQGGNRDGAEEGHWLMSECVNA